jgi:ribosome maturation factor RimP
MLFVIEKLQRPSSELECDLRQSSEETTEGTSEEIVAATPEASVFSPRGDSSGPLGGSLVTLEDCAIFSRAVSRLLDQLYPEEGPSYSLEVSSPGLDRPLNGPKDFERFNGRLAKLTLVGQGRPRRYTGRLETATKPYKLATDLGSVVFDPDEVVSARLKPEFRH